MGGTGASRMYASVRAMWLMLHLRSSLSIPHWLQFSSFVGVSKSVADVIEGDSASWVHTDKVGCSCRGIGGCVVMAPVGQCVPWSSGWVRFHPDLHGFYKWVFDALGVLNDLILSRLF